MDSLEITTDTLTTEGINSSANFEKSGLSIAEVVPQNITSKIAILKNLLKLKILF